MTNFSVEVTVKSVKRSAPQCQFVRTRGGDGSSPFQGCLSELRGDEPPQPFHELALSAPGRISEPRVGSLKAAVLLLLSLLLPAILQGAEANWLKNPGFEEGASGTQSSPNWTTTTDSASQA